MNNYSSPKTLSTAFLSIRPNPFNEQINVEFELEVPQDIRFAIYDMEGKRIYISALEHFESGKQQYYIQTQDFPKGAYILKMASKQVNQSIKLVKS